MWVIYWAKQSYGNLLRQNTTHALFGSNPLAGRIHLLFPMLNELFKIKVTLWWKIFPTIYGQHSPNLKLPFIGNFCDFIKMPDLKVHFAFRKRGKILVKVSSSFKQPQMLIFTWHTFDSFPSLYFQSRNSIIVSWTFWTSLFLLLGKLPGKLFQKRFIQ